jgi:hypothetical protein
MLSAARASGPLLGPPICHARRILVSSVAGRCPIPRRYPDPGLFISLVASRRGGPRAAFGSLTRPLRKRSLRTRVARGLRPCSPTRRGRKERASGTRELAERLARRVTLPAIMKN